MEVTLLIDLGDHKKGAVLTIYDETVITKWRELGVIANEEKGKKPEAKSKK